MINSQEMSAARKRIEEKAKIETKIELMMKQVESMFRLWLETKDETSRLERIEQSKVTFVSDILAGNKIPNVRIELFLANGEKLKNEQ